MRASRLAIGLLVAACAVAWGDRLEAQSTSSSLVGTVRTKDGQSAPGATVEARSVATGVTRSAVTDRAGAFHLDLLAPGAWTLTAHFPDVPAAETLEVTLRLQQVLRVDLTLGGEVTESMTITGQAPLLDPSRTGGELRVDASQADAIPLAGRDVTQLALLDSSVKPTQPGNFYGERGTVFIVNGQSGRANSFLVDGLDNNDQTSGTAPNGFFSAQVMREVVVNTHQYSPEFGRATGAVFNILTEGGSNERLASVFLQGTQSGWNDRGSFIAALPATETQEAVERFAVGFKQGGPIEKDRSFYFFAFEHQEADDIFPYTGTTRDGTQGGWAVGPNRDDSLFLRTDFNLNPANTLMVRLSGDDRSTSMLNVGGITTPENGSHVDEKDVQLAATLTSVLSPNNLNEARMLVARSQFHQFANSERPGAERPSGKFGGNNLALQLRDEDRFEIVDNFTHTTGDHTLKFGASVVSASTNESAQFNPSGNFTYDSDKRFEPGDAYVRGVYDCLYAGGLTQPCEGTPGVDDDGDGLIDEAPDPDSYPVVYQLIFGHPEAVFDETQVGLFAQDAWQVDPRWVLDYGLRYDLSTFRLPKDARVQSTIPNGGAGIDSNNVAPRFGFTFAPKPGGKLLVRGGAGVFYGKIAVGFPAVAAVTSQVKIGLTFPQGFGFEFNEQLIEQQGIEAVLPDVFFPQELILQFSTGTELDTPYTNQFNLGFECALGSRSALQLNVIRALGFHQPLFRDLNPPVGTTPFGLPFHAADPTIGSIAAIMTDGRSWYTGLDLGWRWRGDRSWYMVNYTLSKSLDEGPDPLTGGVYIPPDSSNLASEKGRSDADRRHRVVLAGSFPIGWFGLRGSGVIQIASGAPFNVTTGRDENLDGMTTDRPPGVGRNTGEETPLEPVNELRAEVGLPLVTSLHEPSLVQVDVRVAKPFQIRGRSVGSEVFLQVFNLLDTFNGGPVEGRVTAAGFGRPVGQVGPPRTFELGLKFGF